MCVRRHHYGVLPSMNRHSTQYVAQSGSLYLKVCANLHKHDKHKELQTEYGITSIPLLQCYMGHKIRLIWNCTTMVL